VETVDDEIMTQAPVLDWWDLLSETERSDVLDWWKDRDSEAPHDALAKQVDALLVSPGNFVGEAVIEVADFLDTVRAQGWEDQILWWPSNPHEVRDHFLDLGEHDGLGGGLLNALNNGDLAPLAASSETVEVETNAGLVELPTSYFLFLQWIRTMRSGTAA
jgi:hypothetical protein